MLGRSFSMSKAFMSTPNSERKARVDNLHIILFSEQLWYWLITFYSYSSQAFVTYRFIENKSLGIIEDQNHESSTDIQMTFAKSIIKKIFYYSHYKEPQNFFFCIKKKISVRYQDYNLFIYTYFKDFREVAASYNFL